MNMLIDLAGYLLWIAAVAAVVLLGLAVVGNIAGALRQDAWTRRNGRPGPVPITWTTPRKGNP
ncbi:MAG: hypothetical protein OXC31_11065, partial [Spirochaetaceae bacterium]|nr:hypothetical protein [Spirochaetaceae bacterium]